MAAYAATVRRPDGLILESGFPSARSLVRTSPLLSVLALFSTYRFPADRFLKRLGRSAPVLVLHGDNDHVIPMTDIDPEIASLELAAAVTNAGGLGMISFGGYPPARVKERIKQLRSLTSRPFGVNVLLQGPPLPLPESAFVDVCIEEWVPSCPFSGAIQHLTLKRRTGRVSKFVIR